MTITVYTTPACPQCHLTKRWLSARGIDHLTVDVSATPSARAFVTDDLGHMSAPVIVATDDDGTIADHWSGFQPDRLAVLVNDLDDAA